MKPLYPGDTNMYGYEVSPSIVEQRKDILSRKKKIEFNQEPIRLGVFRIKPGESKEDFQKRVKLGGKPDFYGNAKEIKETTE